MQIFIIASDLTNKIQQQMGNDIWNENGKYITAYKIEEPYKQLSTRNIQYENLFGRGDLSERCKTGKRVSNVLVVDDLGDKRLKAAKSHCPLRHIENTPDNIGKKRKYTPSTRKNINKAYSENPRSKTKQKQSFLSQYDTLTISPVKDESEKSSISRVRVFKSRHQSQYFKIL